MTGELYPGISHGSQVTKASTGEPAWIPRQKAIRLSAVLQRIVWMISDRGESHPGSIQSYNAAFRTIFIVLQK